MKVEEQSLRPPLSGAEAYLAALLARLPIIVWESGIRSSSLAVASLVVATMEVELLTHVSRHPFQLLVRAGS